MKGRSQYPRLTLDSFSRILLETGDLDPAYIALWRMRDLAGMTQATRARWLVAYWCLYHVGAASYLAEQEDFWGGLLQAAQNEKPAPTGGRWPRGRERRHWRGKNAIRCADQLAQRYAEPLDFVNYLLQESTAAGIIRRAKQHHSFGLWIGFKMADMLERCWPAPVDFTAAEVFVFDTPAKAAWELWVQRGLPQGDPLQFACEWLAEKLQDFAAPPRYDRALGLQEFETCLCKWKSHTGGHYPLFNDINELLQAGEEWCGVSSLALSFAARLPHVEVGK